MPITFKPLAHADLPMLLDWLRRPHVAQWWQPEPSLVELEQNLSHSSSRKYIARLDGEPLGFIQSYVAMGSGDGWWEQETDRGRRGIDQFLADGDKLGRGLGSRMVRAFVDRLFEDPAVTSVQTDPSPDNQRAIRCYRRAGFDDQAVVETPDGPALLMLRERSVTKRQRISSGSTFEAQIGYSRAIVAGDWVFVAGTTGFDYSTMTIAGDVVEQARQCLKNIEAALAQAGSSLVDVVRVRYILPDAAQFEACWPVLRECFGEVRPAATMISAGLADPRMKIEIEVTALKQSSR